MFSGINRGTKIDKSQEQLSSRTEELEPQTSVPVQASEAPQESLEGVSKAPPKSLGVWPLIFGKNQFREGCRNSMKEFEKSKAEAREGLKKTIASEAELKRRLHESIASEQAFEERLEELSLPPGRSLPDISLISAISDQECSSRGAGLAPPPDTPTGTMGVSLLSNRQEKIVQDLRSELTWAQQLGESMTESRADLQLAEARLRGAETKMGELETQTRAELEKAQEQLERSQALLDETRESEEALRKERDHEAERSRAAEESRIELDQSREGCEEISEQQLQDIERLREELRETKASRGEEAFAAETAESQLERGRGRSEVLERRLAESNEELVAEARRQEAQLRGAETRMGELETQTGSELEEAQGQLERSQTLLDETRESEEALRKERDHEAERSRAAEESRIELDQSRGGLEEISEQQLQDIERLREELRETKASRGEEAFAAETAESQLERGRGRSEVLERRLAESNEELCVKIELLAYLNTIVEHHGGIDGILNGPGQLSTTQRSLSFNEGVIEEAERGINFIRRTLSEVGLVRGNRLEEYYIGSDGGEDSAPSSFSFSPPRRRSSRLENTSESAIERGGNSENGSQDGLLGSPVSDQTNLDGLRDDGKASPHPSPEVSISSVESGASSPAGLETVNGAVRH